MSQITWSNCHKDLRGETMSENDMCGYVNANDF